MRFAIAAAVISGFAAPWLIALARFAIGSSLYSHIVLIPAVSIGLVWAGRTNFPGIEGRARLATAVTLAVAGASLAYAFLVSPPVDLEPNHRLTWVTAAYVLMVVAAGFWFLGRTFMATNAVAAGFLVFMIPMPGWLERGVEIALQRASAEATHTLLTLSDMTFLREGQAFRFPSITLEIAQECSGIHSSMVLFITSIVAGQMFLRPGWRRWVLTLAVIPLAVVRNGFRVFTLAVLCERIGPHMIHHWIHHRGGPVFFALSLIPFFALLALLRRPDDRGRAASVTPPNASHAPADTQH